MNRQQRRAIKGMIKGFNRLRRRKTKGAFGRPPQHIMVQREARIKKLIEKSLRKELENQIKTQEVVVNPEPNINT